MISTYFVNKQSLDEIGFNFDEKEISDSSGKEYWYLKSQKNVSWVWKDDIFCENDLSKIRYIGNLLLEKRATTGGGREECLDIRRSKISWVPINSQTSWIYSTLTDHINSVNQDWFNYDLDKIEVLQYTRYYAEEIGCYKPHLDPLQWNLPHERKLSFVIQLSDPSEYEGGDLLLHLGHEPTYIPKKLGYAVFFPSHTLHEVTPVTSGVRQTLVGWIHGPKLK